MFLPILLINNYSCDLRAIRFMVTCNAIEMCSIQLCEHLLKAQKKLQLTNKKKKRKPSF